MDRSRLIQNDLNKLKNDQFRTNRFNRLFLFALILTCLCVLLTGTLYIIKNSPDHWAMLLRDRKAPAAVVHDAVSFNGETYDILDFVDSIDDTTEVTASFVQAPDYGTDGMQEIIIRFTDEVGNYSDCSLMLEVIHDTQAPVIYGDDDVYTYWNETISYRSFVEVWDDRDEEVDLEIDNSQVDIMQVGSYDVIYKATDSTGNTSYKTITFHIMAPDTDEYYLMKANELCDRIIDQIITDDMDDLHKVWAVYDYVRNIPYILTDYTRNYIREGYKMLSEYRGDCYGSYASVRLLLDRLGIENIPIQTDERFTRHFWNMVSLDGGLTWYHVDATNWVEWDYHPNMCMISDNRLNRISAHHNGTHMHIIEDYPATPYYSMAVPDDIAATYKVNDYFDSSFFGD